MSDAEVAEIGFTAFTSRAQAEHISARLIVRRVKRLNPKAVPDRQRRVAGPGRVRGQPHPRRRGPSPQGSTPRRPPPRPAPSSSPCPPAPPAPPAACGCTYPSDGHGRTPGKRCSPTQPGHRPPRPDHPAPAAKPRTPRGRPGQTGHTTTPDTQNHTKDIRSTAVKNPTGGSRFSSALCREWAS